jgi:hypothetical protein
LDLPGSSRERVQSLHALRRLIVNESEAVIGLDFPFGLPRLLADYDDWESFVLAFPHDYASAEAFRQGCRGAAQGRELRRVTDRVARTPFSPYNIRLYRQTYYGIRDLLRPLIQKTQACVLPMQEAEEDKPWLLEICPASTLKRGGLYAPYKGGRDEHRSARLRILRELEARAIAIRPGLRSTIVDDVGGDALDSVVAALATFTALRNSLVVDAKDRAVYAIEGYVYVGNPGE